MIEPATFNANNVYTAGTPASENKTKMDINLFMRLLTVQLSNQNPLDPMKDNEFFSQMAQLGQVQGMDDLKASLEVTNASSMIGKTVTAVLPLTAEGSDGVNSVVTGTVEKLSIANGKRMLTLSVQPGRTVNVEIGNVREVRN